MNENINVVGNMYCITEKIAAVKFQEQNYEDKVELDLGNNYEIIVENDKTYVVRKKPKYPKTAENYYKNKSEIAKLANNIVIPKKYRDLWFISYYRDNDFSKYFEVLQKEIAEDYINIIKDRVFSFVVQNKDYDENENLIFDFDEKAFTLYLDNYFANRFNVFNNDNYKNILKYGVAYKATVQNTSNKSFKERFNFLINYLDKLQTYVGTKEGALQFLNKIFFENTGTSIKQYTINEFNITDTWWNGQISVLRIDNFIPKIIV